MIVPKTKKTQKVCITQTFCVQIGQHLSLMTQMAYKTFIRQDRLPLMRDSAILTPRTNQITCAMRHSADHRCKHLPLLVRQRAHIDHSNTYHIYHNILCIVNIKFNILRLSYESSSVNVKLRIIKRKSGVFNPPLCSNLSMYFRLSIYPAKR